MASTSRSGPLGPCGSCGHVAEGECVLATLGRLRTEDEVTARLETRPTRTQHDGKRARIRDSGLEVVRHVGILCAEVPHLGARSQARNDTTIYGIPVGDEGQMIPQLVLASRLIL